MADPIAPGGIMTISGIYRSATRDTVVLQAAGRLPLAKVSESIPVAQNSPWYAASQPLSIVVGRRRSEFARYATPRIIAPGEIALLGRMAGLGVYAPAREVAPMRAILEAESAAGKDLERTLNAHREIQAAMDKIELLYVPVQAAGCVFQPLRRVARQRRG